jgi:hypothetical protein
MSMHAKRLPPGFVQVQFSEVIDCVSLAPTEGRGDSGQNCFHDMSIVGDA